MSLVGERVRHYQVMKIGDVFYMHICIYVRPHLMAWPLCKVGGVKCQAFLKCSKHWKRDFQGKLSYCVGSSFLRLALSTGVKVYALPDHGLLQVFAIS